MIASASSGTTSQTTCSMISRESLAMASYSGPRAASAETFWATALETAAATGPVAAGAKGEDGAVGENGDDGRVGRGGSTGGATGAGAGAGRAWTGGAAAGGAMVAGTPIMVRLA